MHWKKRILRKIQISTSDPARQSPESEVEDVGKITKTPASQLTDTQLDAEIQNGQTRSLSNVPDDLNESKGRQDGRLARETSPIFGASQTPKRPRMNKDVEVEFAHASSSDPFVVPNTSLGFRQSKKNRPEQIPVHPLSGLLEMCRLGNFPPIKESPRRSFPLLPQTDGSSFWSLMQMKEQNEVALNEPIQDFQEESGSMRIGGEEDPGSSSQANKVSNLKRKTDSGNEENEQEGKPKSRTSLIEQDFVTDNQRSFKGDCGECNEVFDHLQNHFRDTHKCKPIKCTGSRDCKKYFTTAQKRIEHEQRVHLIRKEFRCQFCHYSAELKSNLKGHFLRKHSEKKIRCGEMNCGNMFASVADLKNHVKWIHTKDRCRKCGKQMSIAALYHQFITTDILGVLNN